MASTDTTGRYLAEEGNKLFRRLNARIARALRSPGADEMHDLRVAIRRFTRMLAVLKRCYPREESRRIRGELKRIMARAGAVRDHDIALYLLARVTLSEAEPLMSKIRKRREEAARKLRIALRGWLLQNLAGAWRDANKSKGGQKTHTRLCDSAIAVTAREVLPRAVANFFRRGKDAVRHGASTRTIHRFRIAAKNLRYTLDFFAPFYGDSIADLSDQLKDIQDLLGEINDFATVRRLVSDAGSKKILSALAKRQHKKTEKFRRRYTTVLSSGAIQRQWNSTVRTMSPAQFTGRRQPA